MHLELLSIVDYKQSLLQMVLVVQVLVLARLIAAVVSPVSV